MFLPGESQGRGSLVGWHLWGRTESDSSSNKEDTGTKTEMITVGFKPAKAEIHTSTPDDTVLGQHRTGQTESNQQHWEEDLNFIHNTDELRVSPNSLCSKIQPPSPQESLYYGTYYSLQ